jgi:hypothetical protein
MIYGMTGPAKPEGSVEIFCSYSHKDEALRQEFETYVNILKQFGLIQLWTDQQIVPGQFWDKVIDEHLNRADIIVLLISPDFVTSEYCRGKEMARAKERAEREEAFVVPILLRPCPLLERYWFAKLQMVPKDARPLTLWSNRDEAWSDVTVRLNQTLEQVLRNIQAKVKAELKPGLPHLDLDTLVRDQTSWQDVMTVSTPVDAKRQKEQMERWRILMHTQQRLGLIEEFAKRTAADGDIKDLNEKFNDLLNRA